MRGWGTGSPVHDCACGSGPVPQSAVPPRGGRSPFRDLGRHPHCSPRVVELHSPPSTPSTGRVAFPQLAAGGSCSAHAGRLGLHRVSLGLGDGQQFSVHSVFPAAGPGGTASEGDPGRGDGFQWPGPAAWLDTEAVPRRGAGGAGRHRGSALRTGALGTWGPPTAAPHLLCMASEGPDSKAQLGTRAPVSPPEQDSPVGQSHGKLKVCGDLVSGKSVRAVSLASAHFMSLSCFGNPRNISNFFIVIRLAKVIWDQ